MTTTDAGAARGTLTITHTHAEGTTLTGSDKGDGVWEIVKGHGWRFSRHVGLYIRGSRDRDANRAKIAATRAALEAAGWAVTVTVNDQWRPTAERRADADERADERAGWLDERADRAAVTADARRDARRGIAAGIPAGQPILMGHHSQRRHERDIERMDGHMRAEIDANRAAARLAERAAGVRANAAYRNNPRAVMRRVEKLEADRRGYVRDLNGYTREHKNGHGEVYYRDVFPAATGERAERLRRWDARDAEEIGALRAYLAELDASGKFTAWGPDDFRPGDLARVSGRWCEVVRVNKKSVSVRRLYDWHTETDRAQPVPWDEITGRRRDGMQWDGPRREPWPVETARQVARWGGTTRSAKVAHQHPYGSAERTAAGHVAAARRIVHGLPLDAGDREVDQVAASITGVTAARDLACRYLAVFDRLQAGESAADVAAGVDPLTGSPAWRMPTGREPVLVRAARSVLDRDGLLYLQVGDLVAGVRDRPALGGGEARLLTAFSGPVVDVSEVRSLGELGRVVTITLSDGIAQEFDIGRWLAVHPAGTWESPAADDAGADTAAEQSGSVLTGWAAVMGSDSS